MADSVVGLRWKDVHSESQDAGKFRDFSPLIQIQHESEEVLLVVINELVDIFGWKIDVSKTTLDEFE